MRYGRPTNDPKEHMIQLRINDETKAYLDKESKSKGITVSVLVREIINKAMRDSRKRDL